MKIIKPSVQFFGAVPTDYESAIKFIELAGRTCYKSEDKITSDSAEKFVKKLIKAGHLAMVEHSNFVVQNKIPSQYKDPFLLLEYKYLKTITIDNTIYIGGNLTAWYQQGNIVGWDDSIFRIFARIYADLFDITLLEVIDTPWQVCPYDEIPPELHRYSAKFICDRGVSHELVRHRLCSFAQESTRYVNYKGKNMEFIEPDNFDNWQKYGKHCFIDACRYAEIAYQDILDAGLKPQQARAVLPNALKTELIVTADAAEWRHIFNLRCAPNAHPDFRSLAIELKNKFTLAGILC